MPSAEQLTHLLRWDFYFMAQFSWTASSVLPQPAGGCQCSIVQNRPTSAYHQKYSRKMQTALSAELLSHLARAGSISVTTSIPSSNSAPASSGRAVISATSALRILSSWAGRNGNARSLLVNTVSIPRLPRSFSMVCPSATASASKTPNAMLRGSRSFSTKEWRVVRNDTRPPMLP